MPISSLLTEAAEDCKIEITCSKLRKDPPWFDEDCRRLKDSIRNSGKVLRRNPWLCSMPVPSLVDLAKIKCNRLCKQNVSLVSINDNTFHYDQILDL